MAKYEYKDAWYTVDELSEMSGIASHTIRDRLRRGYSIEEAIKPVATHDSIKEFEECSCHEDWVGMSTSDLHKIYWQWCIKNGYPPITKQGFSRQILSMYPIFKVVPTKRGDKSFRIIRMR